MSWLLRIIGWLIFLGAVAAAAMLWFGLEEVPRVGRSEALSQTDVARARNILRKNDPRTMPVGSEHSVRITQGDLNLAANFLLRRVGAGIRIDLRPGTARLSGSLRLPDVPVKPYLNLGLEISHNGDGPNVSGLRVGKIPVPDVISGWLIRLGMAYFSRTEEGRLAVEAIRGLEFSVESVTVAYRVQPDLVERIRDLVAAPGNRDAVQAYYSALARLHRAGGARGGPMVEGLRPLFELARERSLANRDFASENGALLLVLGVWAGEVTDQLIASGPQPSRPGAFRLTLNGRTDLAQHFLVSAAFSSRGARRFAETVGVYKELEDARAGSGFSFADLAADRAGGRFGEVATGSSSSAGRLQEAMAEGVEERALFPDVGDLPPPMNAASFQRRYGAIGTPAYDAVADEIARRVSACPLYREE